MSNDLYNIQYTLYIVLVLPELAPVINTILFLKSPIFKHF